MKRTGLIAAAASVLTIGMTIGRSHAAPIPDFLYLERVALYGGKTAPTAQDQLSVGLAHLQLGTLYDLIADHLGELVGQAAAYYGDTVAYGWGAEYFGALGWLVAGDTDHAREFCTRAKRAKNMPPVLKGLCATLEPFTRGVQSPTSDPDGFRSLVKSRWDSLALCSQTLPEPACAFCPQSIGAREAAGNVTAAPLIRRARLRRLLCDGTADSVRAYISDLDTDAAFWKIAFPGERITEYSDPALVRAMAEAHFIVARDALARAVASGLDPEAHYMVLLYQAQLGFRTHDADFVRTALNNAPDSSDWLAYRGWAHWSEGDHAAAWDAWNRSRASMDRHQAIANLAEVWSALPDLGPQCDSLIANLLRSLGDVEAQKRLRRNNPGRYRLHIVYRTAASWYAQKCVLGDSTRRAIFADSACLLYSAAALLQGLSLDNYQPIFCAGYLVARARSGRCDFLAECRDRWMYLSRYFPVARYMENPLSVLLFAQQPISTE